MSEYLILHTVKNIKLNKQKYLDLEIYLNKTNYGKIWINLEINYTIFLSK